MFAGAHGVRGLVRLRSFTEEPDSIAGYKPLSDETGTRSFKIKLKSSTNDHFIVEVDGVKDRDAAEALRGTKLYVPRAALPKLKKREFYEADLAGLTVKDGKHKEFGTVIAVHNYGGGPFFEVKPNDGKAFMLPFNKACVPEVEIEEGYVVIVPPDGWLESSKDKK
jgi:16S rRNA processing protein RimM